MQFQLSEFWLPNTAQHNVWLQPGRKITDRSQQDPSCLSVLTTGISPIFVSVSLHLSGSFLDCDGVPAQGTWTRARSRLSVSQCLVFKAGCHCLPRVMQYSRFPFFGVSLRLDQIPWPSYSKHKVDPDSKYLRTPFLWL